MTLPNVDNTTLNNLTPNLDIGDVADPALRLAAFQYIYQEMQDIVLDLNASQAPGAITTLKLADGSVVTAKLADGAVTGAKMADGTIVTIKLADGSITTAKIVAGAVGTTQLADGAVTRPKIAPGAVGSSQLDPTLLTNFGDIAVQAEFDRRAVSVLKYGAVGDGVTDCSTALQSAIDAVSASGGGILFFPVGTFVVNSVLTLKANVVLKGAHRRATIIKCKTAGITIISQPIGATSSHVDNMTITSDPATKAAIGIDINDGSTTISNCIVGYCTKGIIITQQYYNLITDTDFTNCTTGLYLAQGVGGANSNQVNNCKFSTCTTAIQMEANCLELGIYACTFEALTNAIIIDGKYATVAACYFESITGKAIDLTSSAVGCEIGINYYASSVITTVSTSTRYNTIRSINRSNGSAQSQLGLLITEATGNNEVRVNNGGAVAFNYFFDNCVVATALNGYYYSPQYKLFPIASSSVQNGSLFIDSADSLLKFKNGAGVVKTITIT